MTRPWLRHPPTPPPPPCPTRLPRYPTRETAEQAEHRRIHGPALTPAACTACNGWHLITTEGTP